MTEKSLDIHFVYAVELREIGGLLKAARMEAGLTQDQVAKSTGLSGRLVGQMENGQTNFQIKTLIDVAKACNCLAVLGFLPDSKRKIALGFDPEFLRNQLG